MRVHKSLIYINLVALAINAILLWLMVATFFPPILVPGSVVGFFVGSVWLSLWANGMLPNKGRLTSFDSNQTEQLETL